MLMLSGNVKKLNYFNMDKTRVIIDFLTEDQAKKFFDMFDAPVTMSASKLINDVMAECDTECVSSHEEMEGEDYYIIELE